MSLTKRRILAAFSTLALSVGLLSGCAGDDVTCGDNTIADNGKCVANTSKTRSCGAGTTVNEDGQCVISADGCSDAASFDSDKNRCVPGSSTCAEGTEFNAETGTCVGVIACGPDTVQNDDGSCVADVGTLCASQPGVTYDPESGNCRVGTSACGPGTQLSAESGTCVISDASCGTGLMINDQGNCVPTDQVCGDQSTLAQVDGSSVCVPDASCKSDDVVLMTSNSTQGICVSPAEKLAANPDRTEREGSSGRQTVVNDPNIDGATPEAIAVKPTGQVSSAVGTIQNDDYDGDGDPDQDIDGFTFNADAGQWFSVSVQSLGLPQPWFRITGPEGFVRTAAVGLDSDPVRQILIPYTGEYTIEVMPTAAATTDNSTNGPYGDSDWKYVLGLEQLPAPSPSDNDFSNSNVTGSLAKLTDNIYTINGFNPGELVSLSADSIGSGGEAILEIWRNPNTLLTAQDVSEGDSVVFQYPTSGSPILVMDWRTATGTSLDFEVSGEVTTNVEALGSIPADGQATSTPRTIAEDPAETYNYTAQVTGGEVIELTHLNGNDEEADITVTALGGGEIFDDGFIDPRNDFNSFDNDEGYFYVASDTEILISVSAGSFGDLTDFELRVNSITPHPTVNNLQAGDQLVHTQDSTANQYRTDWLRFSTSDAAVLDGIVRKLQPANSNPDFDVVLYTASTGELSFNDLFEEGNSGDTVDISGEVDIGDRILSPPGSFLIGIRMEDTVVDRYRIDGSVTGIIQDVEPNDSKANAVAGDIGQLVVGSVGGSDAADWHTFTLDSPLGEYEALYAPIEIDGFDSSGQDCAFHDSSGEIPDPITHPGWSGCLSVISGPLPAGQYWHKISAQYFGSEPYAFSFQRLPGFVETESNNTKANANSIPLSEVQNGVDIFGDAIGSGDDDWIELTVSGGSVPSSFGIDTETIGYDTFFSDPDFELQDADGNTLDDTSGFFADSVLDSGSVSASDGPFYILVTGGGTYDSQYRLSYDN